MIYSYGEAKKTVRKIKITPCLKSKNKVLFTTLMFTLKVNVGLYKNCEMLALQDSDNSHNYKKQFFDKNPDKASNNELYFFKCKGTEFITKNYNSGIIIWIINKCKFLSKKELFS